MAIALFLKHKPHDAYHVDDRVVADSGKHYEIGDRVASGGNAVVHRCYEVVTGEEFAIKFNLARGWQRVRRFYREIRVLKRIHHDQVIGYVAHGKVKAIRPSGSLSGDQKPARLAFLIMPLADHDLPSMLKSRTTRPLYEEYIAQFRGLADALASIHRQAIHRDIKPQNILVKGETWLVSDFGLCDLAIREMPELTRPEEPVGPRFWMSPEALNRAIGNSDSILRQSDVFQMCCIFWFVVTGRHPTGIVSRNDWTGPDHIFDVLAQGLAHNPSSRPTDGADLLQKLERAVLSKQ